MNRKYSEFRSLIIDDNDFMRSLIRDVLESLGFRRRNIFMASDGLEALNLLADEKVHFIISDCRMQPMDGPTFLGKLRDPENSPDAFVPVIFCSANTDERHIERSRDLGLNEVITTSTYIGNLESRVRAVIQRPRPFVNDARYFGPDHHRRRGSNSSPLDRRSTKPA